METPVRTSDAICLYCDNSDIDWLSRPDLDKIPKTKVTTLEERTARVEKVLLSIMNFAHDTADDCLTDNEKTRRRKMLHLALYLEAFKARYENEGKDHASIDQHSPASDGGSSA
jgi:hypothetical protein